MARISSTEGAMTQELPAYAHSLGKVLNEWFEMSNLLHKDVQSLVDAYQDDWSSSFVLLGY
jgi:hypothetical protein